MIEVANRGRLADFESDLRARGFREDVESRLTCRWRRFDPELTLDVMPTDPTILGFASRWYGRVVALSRVHVLPSGREIAVISPALLLATKLEAFRGRGGGDYYGSRDFEDVITTLDGREECGNDVRRAPIEVRDYVVSELRAHLADGRFLDGVYGALRGDPASQERAEAVVLPRVRALVEA